MARRTLLVSARQPSALCMLRTALPSVMSGSASGEASVLLPSKGTIGCEPSSSQR